VPTLSCPELEAGPARTYILARIFVARCFSLHVSAAPQLADLTNPNTSNEYMLVPTMSCPELDAGPARGGTRTLLFFFFLYYSRA